MAEQWVDAATAYRLVAGVTNPPSLADGALCRRAEAGLVTTRASLLVIEDQRSEDVVIPAEFWSTGQRSGLERDWPAGDFSGRTGALLADHWQAFGVTFALGGVLELLPFDKRALTVRGLSVAGKPDWMPAREAVLLAGKAPGVTSGPATILEYARLGFVAGRAVLAQRSAHEDSSELLWEEREWSIPNWFWESCAHAGGSLQNWELGLLGGEVPGSNSIEWMHLSGVHFSAESLQVLLQPAEVAPSDGSFPPDAPTKVSTGGRLPQAWWDEMWCDIWALIHQGDFKPRSQAEVERAMLTWAVRHGQTLGEATARPKARRLYLAYSGEAANFLAE